MRAISACRMAGGESLQTVCSFALNSACSSVNKLNYGPYLCYVGG